MAKKSENKNLIINQVNVKPVYREALDIKKYRNAHKSAEGMSKNRKQLYDIYDDVLIDDHLVSIIGKRINAITNLELKFFDKNNKEVEEMDKVINSTYFEDMLREIINAKFWGFSLLEIDWSTKEGYKNKTYNIDRRHVKPEIGQVVPNPSDNEGVDFEEHPFALFAGGTGYGTLLSACPLVIYKRNNVVDWSDFNEVFGKPYPQGKYTNDETRELLTEAFTKAGFGAFIVAPADADIIMQQGNSGTSNENFKSFREAMNQALSILVLGQNLSTSIDKGSLAAAKEHSDVEDSIHTADREFVIKILNEKLVPILQRLGFVADGSFDFIYMDEMPLTERILIDAQVAAIVPVDDDYFYETYNIPKPTGTVTSRSAQAKAPQQKPVKDKNKPKPENKLSSDTERSRSVFKLFSDLFSKKKKPLPFW